jgi:hypothetical protein
MAKLSERQMDDMATVKEVKPLYMAICDLRLEAEKPYSSMPDDMTLQQYNKRLNLLNFKISELQSTIAYMGHMDEVQDIKYVSADYNIAD